MAVQLGMYTVNSQGQSEAADPYELSLIASNNTEVVPASFSSQGWNVVITVVAGTVNGLTTAPSISLAGSTNPATVDLAPYYDQVGLSSDNATGPGNLDGGGHSYSANALGGTVLNWQGVPFVLGPADQDDVVQAASQTIPLPSGNYTVLFIIGTAVQGGNRGTFTMHYTDGSTSVVTQEFSDWANSSSNPGEYVVSDDVLSELQPDQRAANSDNVCVRLQLAHFRRENTPERHLAGQYGHQDPVDGPGRPPVPGQFE